MVTPAKSVRRGTKDGVSSVTKQPPKVDFPEFKFKDVNKKERINMVMSPETAKRLEALTQTLEPSNKTEVISKAIHILESLVAGHKNGSTFYVKNLGDKKPTELNIFG